MPGVPSITQFDPLAPPWSTLALDQNFSAITALLASANNYSNYLADSGAANVYVVAFGAGITVSYTAGLVVQFKAANANTGASSLNVNSLGAKTITRQNGSTLQAGDIPLNAIVQCQYDGTNFQLQTISNPSAVQPTRTILTGGSGTYTTPANAKRLVIRMIGGGGSGLTNDSGNTQVAGTDGGATTFGTLTAGGGGRGNANIGGTAGTCTGSFSITINGEVGAHSATVGTFNFGGATPWGYRPVWSAYTGSPNGTFYGFGGCATSTAGPHDNGAGGSGAYGEAIITSPSATYSYAVGAAGLHNAGTGGGTPGGDGVAGVIIIDEYYF